MDSSDRTLYRRLHRVKISFIYCHARHRKAASRLSFPQELWFEPHPSSGPQEIRIQLIPLAASAMIKTVWFELYSGVFTKKKSIRTAFAPRRSLCGRKMEHA